MKQYFVDTSAWYALIDRKDPDHGPVAGCLQQYQKQLITSDYVVDETITLLRYRLGWQAAYAFGTSIEAGSVAVLQKIKEEDREAAWQIFCDYRDQALSFTDCTSFALMRRLRVEAAITMDSDFKIFKFTCLP